MRKEKETKSYEREREWAKNNSGEEIQLKGERNFKIEREKIERERERERERPRAKRKEKEGERKIKTELET